MRGSTRGSGTTRTAKWAKSVTRSISTGISTSTLPRAPSRKSRPTYGRSKKKSSRCCGRLQGDGEEGEKLRNSNSPYLHSGSVARPWVGREGLRKTERERVLSYPSEDTRNTKRRKRNPIRREIHPRYKDG